MTLNHGATDTSRAAAQIHWDTCESCGEPLDIEGDCVTLAEGDCE